MASVFGHVAASTAIGLAFFPKQVRPLTILVAGFCAFAPDLDVLGFRFGIPYGSDWGHRGFTHSLLFALLVSGLIGLAFYARADWKRLSAWFILSMISHPLLDMMTNGGRGCALWWPFSSERIFWPFRPIQVSPMSASDFISPWGLEVLASEVVWIGFPCLGLVWITRFLHSLKRINNQ